MASSSSAAPFDCCDMRVNVCLPPSFIGSVRSGIEESLNENLMRFREDIQAVMISYSKIRLPQTSGKIVEESPYISFDVALQAIVFRPVKGMRLVGVVNKVGACALPVRIYLAACAG